MVINQHCKALFYLDRLEKKVFLKNFYQLFSKVLMFNEEKPDHPMQIGAIDLHCDVKDVIEGLKKFYFYL